MLATLLDTLRRQSLLAKAAGILGATWALQLAACEPPRPNGRFKGPALVPPVQDASGVAVTEDAGIVLPPDAGSPKPVDPEEDAGAVVAPEPDPLEALRGDYLMRFDTVTESNQENLGTVTTTTVAYGVMRVTGEDELQGQEWLCFSDSEQFATKGDVTTLVSDDVWPRLAPVKRTLEVNLEAGTWRSGPGTRRQGWKSTAKEMPRDVVAQEDLFLNPDGGYFGVNIRLRGTGRLATLPARFDCSYDVVSYATTSYEAGTLDGSGRLDAARVEADESQSEVYALRATSMGGTAPSRASDINDSAPSTTPTDEIRLAPVEDTWLPSSQADPTPCPTRAVFEGALP